MKPKMILFDYGQTLIVEPQFDWTRANACLYAHASGLPAGMDEAAFCAYSNALYADLAHGLHEAHRELDHVAFLRLLCESIGLTLDISYEEADLLYWDNATHGSFASPGAQELLSYLAVNGIRYGIISNMENCRSAFRARLYRYLPEAHFEFIIASNEYSIRKPDARLFAVAAHRANLPPEAIWYVGDNPNADVLGAHRAGMRPILYTGAHMRKYDALPEVPFDRIEHLREVYKLIEQA